MAKGIKFNDQSQMAVKRYIDKYKMPETFKDGDVTNFKIYLVYRFHMDTCDMKKSDLKGEDKDNFEKVEMYKQYVSDSLYKEVLNWILLNGLNKKLSKKEKKKQKAVMIVAGIPKEGKEVKPAKQVVYYKQQSRLSAFVNRAIDKVSDVALDISIKVNDWLID